MKSFFAVGLSLLLLVAAVHAGFYAPGTEFCARITVVPQDPINNQIPYLTINEGYNPTSVPSFGSILATYKFELNIRCVMADNQSTVNCYGFDGVPNSPNHAAIDDLSEVQPVPKPGLQAHIDMANTVAHGTFVPSEDYEGFWASVYTFYTPIYDDQGHLLERVTFSIVWYSSEQAFLYTGPGSNPALSFGVLDSKWVATSTNIQHIVAQADWEDYANCPGQEAAPVEPPVAEPPAAEPPVAEPPVAPPVSPPVAAPVPPPVAAPVQPPVAPPVPPPVAPPVQPPVAPPVPPPVAAPVPPPVAPPVPPPVAPPVQPPVASPVNSPVAAPVEPPVAEPPVAEPPVAEPPVAEPPVAEPPVAEPPVAPVPPPVAPPVKAPVASPVSSPVAPVSAPTPIAVPSSNGNCEPRGGRGKPRWCPSFLFGDYCNCWIVPVVECTEMAGDQTFITHFGFQVQCIGSMPSVIQIDIGDNNRFESPAMPDSGQPWNFCVPPGGRVRNAFRYRWNGLYNLKWRVGKFLATATAFNRCPSPTGARDLPALPAFESNRQKRDYSGTNDAEIGRGWSNFNSVQTFIRAASTTFTDKIYRNFWFLVDTITVFRGTTPNCQAIAVRATSSEPVSFTFYSDLITISGKTESVDGGTPSAKFYTNLPSYTDSSKKNLRWEVHVDAGRPNSYIGAFMEYECIAPGDYILQNSASGVFVSVALVALVAFIALLF